MSRTILSKVSTSLLLASPPPPARTLTVAGFWYVSSIFDKANRRGNIVSRHDYSGTAAVLARFSRSLEKNIASPQFHPNTSLFPSLTLGLLFTRNLHAFSSPSSLPVLFSFAFEERKFFQRRKLASMYFYLLNSIWRVVIEKNSIIKIRSVSNLCEQWQTIERRELEKNYCI